MKWIIDKIQDSQKDINNSIKGIFFLEKELSPDEFIKVIDTIGARMGRIAVIDSQTRELNGLSMTTNCIGAAPSAIAKIGERISICNGQIHRDKANILFAEPDYVVYRELICKTNIREIVNMFFAGYNVITFSNLPKDEIIQLLINSVEYMSLECAKRLFNHIEYFNV